MTTKQNRITTDTLIPIGVLGVLAFVVFFVTSIDRMATGNHEDILELQKMRFEVDKRLFDRLHKLESNVSYMRGQMDQVNGRLEVIIKNMTEAKK